MVEIRLYISGRSKRSEKAIEDLSRILEKNFSSQYELTVIDLMEDLEPAIEDDILATPTVVRRLPLPIRKIIGDLSDEQQILKGLKLIDN